MRGGATETTVVVADGPIEAPPTVPGGLGGARHAPRARRAGLAPAAAGRAGSGQHHRVATVDGSVDASRSSRCRPPTLAVEAGNGSWPPRWSCSAPAPRSPVWSGSTPCRRAVTRCVPAYRAQHVEAQRAGPWLPAPGRCRRDVRGVAGAGADGPVAVDDGGDRSDEDTRRLTRGTVVIDVEACKGCNLCIDACPPGVLEMTTTEVNGRGYRYPRLLRRVHRVPGVLADLPRLRLPGLQVRHARGAAGMSEVRDRDRQTPGRPSAPERRRCSRGARPSPDAMVAAGCRFFAGYPMTPFTEVLEHMARLLPAVGGVCMNAESELEAVGMAWGAAATGTPAATGSTGPGPLAHAGVAGRDHPRPPPARRPRHVPGAGRLLPGHPWRRPRRLPPPRARPRRRRRGGRAGRRWPSSSPSGGAIRWS